MLSTFLFKRYKLTRKLNCFKYGKYYMTTGLDLLTMLWTTKVLINKIIYEQQPRILIL